MARKVILSNETRNTWGFHVINSSIDWSRYKKNPVLLRNKKTGEHYGEPVGRVDPDSIVLEGGNWVGELLFDTTPEGKEAEKKFDEGSLNAVSIWGWARKAERNGRVYTTRFEVGEISLVNVPSNPDAVAIRDAKVGLSVSFELNGEETIEALSANDISIINQFEQKMNEDDKKDEVVSLSAIERLFKAIGLSALIDKITAKADPEPVENEKPAAEPAKEGLAASEEKQAEEEPAKEEKPEGLSATEKEAAHEKEEGSKEGLAAEAPATDVDEAAKETGPTGLSTASDAKVYNNEPNQNKTKKMIVPFHKYIADPANASKIQSVVGLSASSGTGDGLVQVGLSAGEDAEARDAVVELAASMKADARFMATVKNMTFQVNEGRKVSAVETIEGLASGDKSGAFVQNADLAKVVWLSLFVRQLFPPNTWADRVRRLSVRDREGIIWVESAINPAIYFGDRAPLNAPNYLYDDLPRGLERKVFSLQPIVWQSANTDVLNYNDVATGTAEAMAIMSNNIHEYWLQMIAEAVPATNFITMTGEEFDAANRFPINPAAAGTLHGMTANDLIGAQGRFLARNLRFTSGSGVAVFAEPYFTSLKQQDNIQSSLTLELNRSRPDFFHYGGFDILARSIVSAFETTTNTVVDPEHYFTYPVDFATGAIDTAHVKPVLLPTAYDIGLGFVPEEVIVAIGNTNIHMVSDPNNYGWKMSMDVSTGAGTLRSSAAGIALFRPTPVTATP